MTGSGDDEDDGDLFLESLDRLLSSSSAGEEEEDDDDSNYAPATSSHSYDIWISEPSSVQERRSQLLHRMGLAGERRSALYSATCTPEFTRSSLSFSCSGSNSYTSDSSIARSKSDRIADPDDNINNNNLQFSSIKNNGNSNLSVHFPEKNITINSFSNSVVNSPSVLAKSRSGNNDVSPSKPPTGKICRRMEEIKSESLNIDVEEETLSVCTIKNLDTGKEFVVNEVREDGMCNKLKEVGTGRQLTMEEFETCVGHSPIVQELMRRQNVEDGNKDNLENSANGSSGSGPKTKKKGSWLKSIRNVASSMTGHKERRSSDERDTSSEKGGQRSSSATDDSQDVSFHGPERVRVRQYGKTWKEVSALYKSQEIQAHNGSIWSIKFSLDGKYLASAGEDCVIHVWQVVESERKGDLLMDKPEDGNLSLLFLANGSPELSSLSPSLERHPEKKRRGRSSISRKSVGIDHILVPETVFALTEKPVCSFQGHVDDVLDLSWSKSQHLLSSSMDKTVRLWHLSSNSCLKIFSHSDYVTCIQFNPVDDNYFISGSLDAKVRIWSIPDRQVVDWNDMHEMVTAACYTPDGQGALVGSYKGSCRVYNTSENKLQQKGHINLQNKKKKSHQKKITGFQFAPGSSSEVLITSADSRVRVIDDVDLVHKFKGFRNTNSQISASLAANGKYVVCASEDSHVYIWRHDSVSRPNRSKGVTVTRSYEHFHCQDVSVAIPWPGMTDSYGYHCTSSVEQNRDYEVSTLNHPPTPVEENKENERSPLSRSSNSPLHGTISSASNSYFFDRISATWPEEKLVLATKDRSPRVSVDFTNEVISHSRSAWGMIIVTAGLKGEIRTFQNFGMPVRV